MLQVNLTKDPSTKPLQLSLNKNGMFRAKLYWSSSHDVDASAFQLAGHKATSFDDLLTTYNTNLVKVQNTSEQHRSGCKKPFQNISGSLVHLGDARTGIQVGGETLPDEIIEVHLNKLPQHIDEVTFILSIHPPSTAKFKDVNNCYLVIEDEQGVEQLRANLTNDWDAYAVVQMGSVVKDSSGTWVFSPISCGVPGDLNTAIGAFS